MVTQKSGLNRAILDGAAARLREFIRYKAERAGGEMRARSPRRTSIDCAAGGRPVPKALFQCLHRCDGCGFTVHRDENAACNIRRLCFGDEAAIVTAYRQGQGGAGGRPRARFLGRRDLTTTNGGVVVPGRLNHSVREDAAKNIRARTSKDGETNAALPQQLALARVRPETLPSIVSALSAVSNCLNVNVQTLADAANATRSA